MSPVETQWMVLLFGICWCFKTASFPQQRSELSALKREGDPRQTVCTWFQYLYIWDSSNVDFCSDERGKSFLECLVGSDSNPWNRCLKQKFFQENQRKLRPRSPWYTLMQLQMSMKPNWCFLGPSVSSSFLFIAVIIQGLYWGSL